LDKAELLVYADDCQLHISAPIKDASMIFLILVERKLAMPELCKNTAHLASIKTSCKQRAKVVINGHRVGPSNLCRDAMTAADVMANSPCPVMP